MSDDKQALGRRIAAWRKHARLSREALAERCEVSYEAVYQWEKGDTSPTLANLTRICNACDLSGLSEFWGPLPTTTKAA